jgi:hypothetical protein
VRRFRVVPFEVLVDDDVRLDAELCEELLRTTIANQPNDYKVARLCSELAQVISVRAGHEVTCDWQLKNGHRLTLFIRRAADASASTR